MCYTYLESLVLLDTRTSHTWFEHVLNTIFAYQIGFFSQNHRQQRMIPPKKTNMTLANHPFLHRRYILKWWFCPCFAIGMSVFGGRYDGKDYDLWAERLGAEGWSWNEVSWRLTKKGSVFLFLMGTW